MDIVKCGKCGTTLSEGDPQNRLKCPNCGSVQRFYSAELADGVEFTDDPPLSPDERRRRVVLLCCSFMRNLAFHRDGRDTEVQRKLLEPTDTTGLPQPRSSRLFAAMIWAMCGAAGSFNIPASVAMASGPCSRTRWCTSTSNFLSSAVFRLTWRPPGYAIREGLGSLGSSRLVTGC